MTYGVAPQLMPRTAYILPVEPAIFPSFLALPLPDDSD